MPHRSPGATALAIALLAGTSTAAAHHSTAFYSSDFVELEGEIARIDWVNPHVRFELRATGADGEEKLYRLEASAISAIERRGVTRELFNVGDRVTVAAHVSTRNPLELQVTNVLLADGREASLWLDSPARFGRTGAAMIARADTVVDAEAENRGLFRVWTPTRPPTVTQDAVSNLRMIAPAAIAGRQSFDLLDNFATRCEPRGMPMVMFSPLSYELIDRGTTIELRGEVDDMVRTIHMDRTAPPPGEADSILGYSVGRWEDGVLVVTTTLVDWPLFDGAGTPQGDQAEFVERFRLSDDQTRLDLDVEVHDPVYLTAPGHVSTVWFAYGDELKRFDCQASL
jgi:hypothetical protein